MKSINKYLSQINLLKKFDIKFNIKLLNIGDSKPSIKLNKYNYSFNYKQFAVSTKNSEYLLENKYSKMVINDNKNVNGYYYIFENWSNDYIVNYIIYPIIELVLFTKKYITIHCSAVQNDYILLFLGKSGTGKSTNAFIYNNKYHYNIIADDRIFLNTANYNFIPDKYNPAKNNFYSINSIKDIFILQKENDNYYKTSSKKFVFKNFAQHILINSNLKDYSLFLHNKDIIFSIINYIYNTIK